MHLGLTVAGFREALKQDDPIVATDHELAELAYLCAEELRRRYPMSAVDQGDLPDRDEATKRHHFVIDASINLETYR